MIKRTYNYKRIWTWIRRVLLILVLIIYSFFQNYQTEKGLIQIIFAVGFSLYILLKPKDDVGVDDTYFYYFQTSLFRLFSKVKQYKIADMYSFNCSGFHDDKWELIDFFNGFGNQGGYANHIEILFNDDSSTSISVSVDKNKLIPIISRVHRIMMIEKKKDK
ncbi:MAG: hypothetical protein OEY34_07965 [Cyclobacteriaceae bacterium]|nr:hypothetical protein [Cyclobacteriaceae bacterium]